MFRCFDPEDPVTGKLPVLGCPPDTLRASDGYSSDNLLTSASGGVTLSYDPLGRLYQVSSASGTTRFAYDGLNPIAEYDGSNVLQKRFVFGKDVDEPVAVYSGSSLRVTGRLYPQLDERGSVIALFNADGTPNTINSYDEYGAPGAANTGRFQYTGQMLLTELGSTACPGGLFYYKARFYSPCLGRFLQTDRVGYQGGINLYAYDESDPINNNDPTGDDCCYGSQGYHSPPVGDPNAENFARGAYSYFAHNVAYWHHELDLSGVNGEAAQNRAMLVEQQVNRGISWVKQHPNEALRIAKNWLSNNKAYFSGRVGVGVGVSWLLPAPGLGLVPTYQAAYGAAVSAIGSAVSQLEHGGYDTSKLSNGVLGAVATVGIAGGTVQFDAKSGNLSATVRSVDLGSRIPQPHTIVICNVKSAEGC